MEALVDSLLADGHLGIFAAFLVFQFVTMQKRLDKLVEKFQEQIEGYEANVKLLKEQLDIKS